MNTIDVCYVKPRLDGTEEKWIIKATEKRNGFITHSGNSFKKVKNKPYIAERITGKMFLLFEYLYPAEYFNSKT